MRNKIEVPVDQCTLNIEQSPGNENCVDFVIRDPEGDFRAVATIKAKNLIEKLFSRNPFKIK